jgi:hypothetical protein
MMKREPFAVADIYVPIKRRTTLEQSRVDEIAASMLDSGQQTPILVRADGKRVVLVKVCSGWRLRRRSAKKLLSGTASTRESIEPAINCSGWARANRPPRLRWGRSSSRFAKYRHSIDTGTE